VWFSAVVVFLLTGQPCFFGAEARGPFFPVICIFLLLYLFPSRERRRMYLWIGVFSRLLHPHRAPVPRKCSFGRCPEAFVIQEYYFNAVGSVFGVGS
jgi:hypothetical protein